MWSAGRVIEKLAGLNPGGAVLLTLGSPHGMLHRVLCCSGVENYD